MKTRIITALILIAICAPIIYVGGWMYVVLIALAITASSIEICQTGHGNNNWPRRVKVITIGATLLMVFWNVANMYFTDPTSFEIASSTLIIPPLGIAATILAYFLLVILKSSINVEDVAYLFTMTMLITLAGQSALFTRWLGFHALIYVCVVSFMTDTGAYFTGYFLGRNKINPRISPKKTYEGAIGGTIIGTISGIAYSAIFYDQIFNNGNQIEYYWFIIISFVLSIFAQIGDFTFSAIKRHYGVKDFGKILPGHGGVLDRIDSILVNLIVFSLIVINILRGFSWWVA